jgi:hypothetical protein
MRFEVQVIQNPETGEVKVALRGAGSGTVDEARLCKYLAEQIAQALRSKDCPLSPAVESRFKTLVRELPNEKG